LLSATIIESSLREIDRDKTQDDQPRIDGTNLASARAFDPGNQPRLPSVAILPYDLGLSLVLCNRR
jgi:hypothetical protein